MFLGLDGTVYDYFDGEKDLKNRMVRFVGDPVTRIQEDYLRILRYFRFYGRIAEEADKHCPHTLEAIKNNAQGLKIVSGERIWMEWKKILTGNFAQQLTQKMIEVGLSNFIGLPDSPNIQEFDLVASRSQENKMNLLPTTLLAALLATEEQVWTLHGRLKLSGNERDNALYVVTHRQDKPLIDQDPLRSYQYLMVDGKTRDTRQFISEVLSYRGDKQLLQAFQNWQPPKFPITGNHLKEAGAPPGKAMSIVLSKLKDEWKQSNFTMDVDTLISHIPDAVASITVEDIKNSPPMKRKREKSKNR